MIAASYATLPLSVQALVEALSPGSRDVKSESVGPPRIG